VANPQTENGFLRIAKEIIEKGLLKTKLSGSQQRILWALWLKTWGWGKVSDCIPISQFEQMTGLDRRHTVRTLKELEGLKMITVERNSTRTAKYSFEKDYEAWLLPKMATAKKKQLLPILVRTIAKNGNKTIAKNGTLKRKENITKDNIRQKLSDKVSLSGFLDSLNEPFLNNSTRDKALLFLDRIRLANKGRTIEEGRALRIIKSLSCISEKYGAANMVVGIDAVFKKDKKSDFDFKTSDPCGYVRWKARSEFTKTVQRQVEVKSNMEKQQLRSEAGSSDIFKEIQNNFLN